MKVMGFFCAKLAKKRYFGKETEDAIVEYNTLTDSIKKNTLFEKSIYKPLKTMAESIIQRFKVYYVEEGYVDELVLHMYMNIDKYNQEKGKAFSYFSYMARNKAWKDNKIAYDKIKNDDQLDITDNIDESYHKYISNDYDEQTDMEDNFTDVFVKKMEDKIDKLFPNKVDNSCAHAILDVIEQRDKLESFDKKSLGVYTKEMTPVSDSRYSEVFKVFQREFKKMYNIYLNEGELS